MKSAPLYIQLGLKFAPFENRVRLNRERFPEDISEFSPEAVMALADPY